MKRNILYTLIFLLVSNFAFTQVDINPSALEFNATEEEDQLYQEFHIVNNGDADINIYWNLELPDNFPNDWTPQICDINLCYGWGSLESNPAAPNMIPSGADVKFSIKVKHIEEDGIMNGYSHAIIRLYDDAEKTNEVASSLTPTVSTTNLDLATMVIYPNPTTDMIQIKNDADITAVSIYNIVGRQVSHLSHTAGAAHDVSALRTGMYLVRLENKNGNVVKAMRLSKR